jgi:hypothetical protein
LCARQGTEKYSGQVAASLNLTDILGERLSGCHRSQRAISRADEEAIWIVAERIAAEVDTLLASAPHSQESPAPAGAAVGCSCGSPPPEGNLQINGKVVTVNGLPLIFEHLQKQGLQPGQGSGDRLLETVRIYHPVEPGEDEAYRFALVTAYEAYCQRHSHKTGRRPEEGKREDQ